MSSQSTSRISTLKSLIDSEKCLDRWIQTIEAEELNKQAAVDVVLQELHDISDKLSHTQNNPNHGLKVSFLMEKMRWVAKAAQVAKLKSQRLFAEEVTELASERARISPPKKARKCMPKSLRCDGTCQLSDVLSQVYAPSLDCSHPDLTFGKASGNLAYLISKLLESDDCVAFITQLCPAILQHKHNMKGDFLEALDKAVEEETYNAYKYIEDASHKLRRLVFDNFRTSKKRKFENQSFPVSISRSSSSSSMSMGPPEAKRSSPNATLPKGGTSLLPIGFQTRAYEPLPLPDATASKEELEVAQGNFISQDAWYVEELRKREKDAERIRGEMAQGRQRLEIIRQRLAEQTLPTTPAPPEHAGLAIELAARFDHLFSREALDELAAILFHHRIRVEYLEKIIANPDSWDNYAALMELKLGQLMMWNQIRTEMLSSRL